MGRQDMHPQLDFETLVALLQARAAHQPEQQGYLFLTDGEQEERSLTYAELDRRARSIAARLSMEGLQGKQVLLFFPVGLDYIATFFGCLYAGTIAIPAYLPKQNRYSQRIETMIVNSQATVALTTAKCFASLQQARQQMPHLQHMRILIVDEIDEEAGRTWQNPGVVSTSLAFLQYTSGSTSVPRGVMLTHYNLLHNIDFLRYRLGHTPGRYMVSWLPPFHDMGLIGCILLPLYANFPVVLLPPTAFLQRPIRWLQAISRYRAITSGGPNFAYELCCNKIVKDQLRELDLRCWDQAFNGAEPVRAEVMERFAQLFAPCGFRKEAFYPCYGLAEATLFVAGGARGAGYSMKHFCREHLGKNRIKEEQLPTAQTVTLVGCGFQADDQDILIVDPETGSICSSEHVGEIWLSGPAVGQGYWKRPEETRATFFASLSDRQDKTYLRTGDLGFLWQGQLFPLGRLADRICIDGINYYPQDIEMTIRQSHVLLQHGNGAAFSIKEGDHTRLIVVHEVDRHFKLDQSNEITQAIRNAVWRQHTLLAYAIVLIRASTLPKTSSGKIQRYACRDKFFKRELEMLSCDILSTDIVDVQLSDRTKFLSPVFIENN